MNELQANIAGWAGVVLMVSAAAAALAGAIAFCVWVYGAVKDVLGF